MSRPSPEPVLRPFAPHEPAPLDLRALREEWRDLRERVGLVAREREGEPVSLVERGVVGEPTQ